MSMKNRFKIAILITITTLVATGAWAQDFVPYIATMKGKEGSISIHKRDNDYVISISNEESATCVLTKLQLKTIIFVLQRYAK